MEILKNMPMTDIAALSLYTNKGVEYDRWENANDLLWSGLTPYFHFPFELEVLSDYES